MAMFFSAGAFSQEEYDEPMPPEEEMEREMHMHSMRLELEQREADLKFDREMKELELEKRRIALGRARKTQKDPDHFKGHGKEENHGILIVLFVVHILLAVWVYKDIRTRNSGSGIWIVIVLLTGLLGVLPYTIVRLGEIRQAKS